MKDIISCLDALLPHKIRMLLSELGELAQKENLHVYLVGGFVRDLLMNHRNLDIDLVVEGDGVAFAKKIVKSMEGRLTYHEKFGTAVVILPDDFRIDVASARTEVYEKPAALPKVKPGTLREDLFRRDFTINAMAIALNTPRFGELIDYFGGKEDISKRQIAVLHERSFIDDPTRLFRAVRFEQRYGFRISPSTEKLAHSALKANLLKELTGVRLRDEVISLLLEPAPWHILKRLDDLGVLEAIHPKLKMGKKEERLFREINKALLKLKRDLKRPPESSLVYLTALLGELPLKDISRLLSSFKMKSVDTKVIVQAAKETPRLLKTLKRDMANSRLYRLLENLSTEAIAFVYAQAGSAERDKISCYFSLKGTKLQISGDDFIRLGYKPSEDFKKVLDRVLDAKLNGKVATKEEELSLASHIFNKLEREKTKLVSSEPKRVEK